MVYRLRPIWIHLVLIALIFAAYGQVARFEFVNYDDPDYVTQNPYVISPMTPENVAWAFTTGYAANWHPLTWLSHMLDYQLFGLNSGMHHLTNVVLHAVSAMLLFAALRQLTGALWPSAIVAALFAVHPLRAESVAWVAERKDTLSICFWMLTLWAYARYVRRPSALRYCAVIVSFALGLMAKSMLVTLPFVLLLLDFWPLRRIDGENRRSRIVEKIPLLAMSLAVSVVTYTVQQMGGAVRSLEQIHLLNRVENALVSYVAYLRMLFWPVGLSPMYPFPSTIPLWQPIAAMLFLLAVTAIVLMKLSRYPYMAMGWFWYIGTLVPVLGLVQIGEQAHADRYTYVPSIGILLIVVWGTVDVLKVRPQLARAVYVASVAAVGGCLAASVLQVSYWRNTRTLFTHATQVTENNYLAYDGLGALMLSQDKPAEALSYLSKALEYNPRLARAHAKFGIAADDLGRPEEAMSHFKQALRLDPDNADAHAGLGLILAENGAADESLAQMREAIRLRPDYAPDYFKLGEAYGLLDRLPEAEQTFRESIRLAPSDQRSYYNLGIALGKQGKLPEAVAAFREAIRLKPEYPNAWFNLGSALAQEGNLPEAISAFGEAVRLKPDFEDAREGLAGAQELLSNEGGEVPPKSK